MIAALLALALALLSWPPRRAAARAGSLAGAARAGVLRRAAAVPGGGQLVHPWLVGCAAAAVTAAVSTPLVAALAAVVAGLAGRARITRRRERAGLAALLSAAEALGALAAELRSGRPLEAALGASTGSVPGASTGSVLGASREAEAEPMPRSVVAQVIRAAVADQPVDGWAPPGLAPPLREALARVAGAARLSVRTGCSLATVLGAVEDELRARHRAAQDLQAATAGSRASAALLAGLPVLALAMGSGVGADPWHVLTATAPGQAMLVAGVVLELAGVAWTGRLIRRAVR